jgi:tetratricopeptide (TPR) repeat protein
MIIDHRNVVRLILGVLEEWFEEHGHNILNGAWMRNAGWIVLAALLVAGCTNSKTTEDKKTLQAGYDALGAQNYDGAMARASEFIANNPNGGPGTPDALYLQGRVYEHRAEAADTAGRQPEARSDLQDARGTYEHALTLNPSPNLIPLLQAGVANAAYFQEDYFTAMRNWAAAYPGLTQPDSKAWVKYRLGLCQQRLGRFDEADRSFAEVQQQFPHTAPAERASVHQGAKAFYVALGSWADAKTADAIVATLRAQGFTPVKSTAPDGRQAIRVGPANNYDQAKALRARLLSAYPAATIEP